MNNQIRKYKDTCDQTRSSRAQKILDIKFKNVK